MAIEPNFLRLIRKTFFKQQYLVRFVTVSVRLTDLSSTVDSQSGDSQLLSENMSTKILETQNVEKRKKKNASFKPYGAANR